MAWKDYYVVLGVPRDEDDQGIRRAFRELALRHHPDRAGPGGTQAFRDAVEAYRVLSDPEQRRRHDAELGDGEAVRVQVHSPADPRSGEPLCCDVWLSRAEARTGGVLPVRIPLRVPCPSCHGDGHILGFPCRSCDARGHCRAEAMVPLEVPPDVRAGTLLELPLERWGMRNLWLRARISVG